MRSDRQNVKTLLCRCFSWRFFAQHEYRDWTHTLAEVHLIVSVVLHFGHAGFLCWSTFQPLRSAFSRTKTVDILSRDSTSTSFFHTASRLFFLLLSNLNLNVCYFVRKSGLVSVCVCVGEGRGGNAQSVWSLPPPQRRTVRVRAPTHTHTCAHARNLCMSRSGLDVRNAPGVFLPYFSH